MITLTCHSSGKEIDVQSERVDAIQEFEESGGGCRIYMGGATFTVKESLADIRKATKTPPTPKKPK